MDLDLLNYYITNIGFKIENSHLVLELEPSKYPLGSQYQIVLSDDKSKIMHFFGYDACIDFDHLSEKNLFVYLSSSDKLYERHIRYDSFKRQSSKNNHRKFNDFLMKNRRYISEYSQEELKKIKNIWQNNAIKYWKIEDKILRYQHEKDVKDKKKVMAMYYATELTLKNHNKLHWFIRYWGVNNIKDWTQDQFNSEWLIFQNENWSNLQHF